MSTVRRSVLAMVMLVCGGRLVAAEWTIYVANDNCPDYTWGLTEEQTRQAFADVIKGHLDEMKRTDGEQPENQDRYNAAVTNEIFCFLEKYPDRKDELVRRIKQGRLYVSPYLCNSLWGLQSFEGTLRTFYPARRLERELGIPMEYAHHIELPSLPWGHATILSGCGIKGLTVPFYNYDSRFAELTVPPLFWHEGPDGSRVKVCLDAWASNKASYMQGQALLKKPEAIGREWLPHYAGLGDKYPLRAVLAAGTHGDIAAGSGRQAREFAEKIIAYNAQSDRAAKLVNATYPQFWQAVEASEKEKPWLPTVRGCFGHSWEAWPVSLAKYAAEARKAERLFLNRESLVAVALPRSPELAALTRQRREQAEWHWAMLSDHAWNGTDSANQRHNAELRKRWTQAMREAAVGIYDDATERLWEFSEKSGEAERQLCRELAKECECDCTQHLYVFNDLPFPRSGVMQTSANDWRANRGQQKIASQLVGDTVHFLAADVPAFGFNLYRLDAHWLPGAGVEEMLATAQPDGLETRHYRVAVDPPSGGMRVFHKPTGRELNAGDKAARVESTLLIDGQTHAMTDVKTEVVTEGPLLAQLRITGRIGDATTTTLVTVYEPLNQVDIEYRVRFPATTKENRLCHAFPFLTEGAQVRVATPGAVVRPILQPHGDLLPGADPRRMAVQEFVSIERDDLTVTLVPLDAFLLHLNRDTLAFEAIGNDQNYKEVSKDQNGETEFVFRYVLRADAGGYRQPRAYKFAAAAARPLAFVAMRARPEDLLRAAIDPARAIATCLKPADDPKAGGCILRVQETAGKTDPVTVNVWNVKRAVATDLLERDREPLLVKDGRIELPIRPLGFATVRLLP